MGRRSILKSIFKEETQMAYQDEDRGAQAQLSEYERMIGYDVEDKDGGKVGKVETLWEDHTGQPAFLGIRTGWLGLGKIHVVPAEYAAYSDKSHAIRLPFDEETIKSAPDFDAESEFTNEGETRLYDYYQGRGFGTAFYGRSLSDRSLSDRSLSDRSLSDRSLSDRSRQTDWSSAAAAEEDVSTARPGAELKESPEDKSALEEGIDKAKDMLKGRRDAGDIRDTDADLDRTIPLSEERLNVGKRQVEAGGVRLRKVIKSEIVNQPVELKREEIEIERVPASGRGESDFREEDIFIPLRREIAETTKDTQLREEVRLKKRTETDREQVSGDVRREDVEIDREGDSDARRPRSP
jgi:uncharacterized protein (TIGR02271 family)